MKRLLYISLFTILGFILQFLLHAIVEQWYIGLLIGNFDVYGFGLSWDAWFNIHTAFGLVLAIVGLVLGLMGGIYWWGRLYDSSGNLKPNRREK